MDWPAEEEDIRDISESIREINCTEFLSFFI